MVCDVWKISNTSCLAKWNHVKKIIEQRSCRAPKQISKLVSLTYEWRSRRQQGGVKGASCSFIWYSRDSPWDPVRRTEWTQWNEATSPSQWSNFLNNLISWMAHIPFNGNIELIDLPKWAHSDEVSNWKQFFFRIHLFFDLQMQGLARAGSSGWVKETDESTNSGDC